LGRYQTIKYENEYTTTYKYTKQGFTANFKLTVFQDKVLEYQSNNDEYFQTNYFDKKLWIEYTKSDTEFKNSKWILTEEQMSEHYTKVIQSYYTLIGFNSRDEYGWICEYSATGSPPDKRLAVIELINYGRRDFFIILLDHPNIQTKLYAADALIYLDMIGEVKEVELLKLGKKKKRKRYKLKYNKNQKLSKEEWRKINRIKKNNFSVITCENMGSYKQYKSTTGELLSEKSVNEIYKNYQLLKEFGYLN